MVLEQPVEILAVYAEEAAVVEIVHFAGGEIEAIDRDGRLSVLLAIADTASVRHVVAVHLDEAEPPPGDLLGDVGLDAVEDGKFGDADAVKLFKVLQGHLEEGQLVALEILRQGEAEHGLRPGAERGEHLDPQIDIAVGFRPHAIARMQRMRRVGGRIQSGEDRCRHRISPRARHEPMRATGRRRGHGDGTAQARCVPDQSPRRPCARRSRPRD